MDKAPTKKNHKRREFIGTVTSDKMQKTIVVEVERLVQHALYRKTIKRKIKFKVHDEKNEAKIGDRVRIVETRPLSKDKRWRLLGIIARAAILGKTDDL